MSTFSNAAAEVALLFTKINSILSSAKENNSQCFGLFDDTLRRYRLWAVSLGAIDEQDLPHSRMNFSEHPQPAHQHLYRRLEELSEILEDVRTICEGQRSGQEFDAATCVIESGGETTEFHELLLTIKDIVTSLFKISSGLQFHKRKEKWRNLDSNIQLNDSSDRKLIAENYPYLEEHRPWLSARLGKANAQRRFFISHRKVRLDHETEAALENSGLASDTASLSHSTPSGHRTIRRSAMPRDSTEIASPFTRLSILPDKTKSDQLLASILPASGLFSTRRFPLPPDGALSGEIFVCPICFDVESFEDEDTSAAWNKHVHADVLPYTCTFEDCSEQCFASTREWFDHELRMHRLEYRCPYCSLAPSKAVPDFVKHLVGSHRTYCSPDLISGNEEECLRIVTAYASPKHVIDLPECPFCGWIWLQDSTDVTTKRGKPYVKSSTFRDHVGAHLLEVALFSLVRIGEEQIDDSHMVRSPNAVTKTEITAVKRTISSELPLFYPSPTGKAKNKISNFPRKSLSFDPHPDSTSEHRTTAPQSLQDDPPNQSTFYLDASTSSSVSGLHQIYTHAGTFSIPFRNDEPRALNLSQGDAPFRVIRTINRSSQREVAEVQNLTTGLYCVRKAFQDPPINSQSGNMVSKRVELEVRIIQKLRHQHIVSVIFHYQRLFTTNMIICPVAEDNLQNFLATHSTGLDTSEAVLMDSWFGCLISALTYVHASKISHGNIKPAKIIIHQDKIYLSGFGSAQNIRDKRQGSARPPVHAGDIPTSLPHPAKDADIYALGLVYFEMLLIRLRANRRTFLSSSRRSNSEKGDSHRFNPSFTTRLRNIVRSRGNCNHLLVVADQTSNMIHAGHVRIRYAEQVRKELAYVPSNLRQRDVPEDDGKSRRRLFCEECFSPNQQEVDLDVDARNTYLASRKYLLT